MKEFETGSPAPPPAPKGPSPEEQARERELQLQGQKQAAEIEAARSQAKAEAMERFLQQSFARGRSEAPPQEAVRAQQDLGLTEEEILADPTGSIAKLSDHIRRQNEAMVEYQNRANSVIGNLAKSNFKSEMSALGKERYAEWLAPYVEDYFRNNPEEAFKDGSVRRIYNELVGQNIEELERLHKEKAVPPGQVNRERVIEQSTGASNYSPEPPRKETSALPEDEMFMLSEHNRRAPQYAMTPEEWADIRSGKKFPKKISTDIQYRGAKPNVSY